MALTLVTKPPRAVSPRARALAPRPRLAPLARDEARGLVEREVTLVAMRCLLAIVRGWDTRRLGYPNECAHPFESEVCAIVGLAAGYAPEKVAQAQAEVDGAEAACRAHPERASRRSPLGALAAELGLTPRAVEILVVVAAPELRGELARLYSILANSTGRPLCDELLVAQILGAEGAARHELAAELDPARPLLRSGALRVDASRPRPFAGLSVHPRVLARLRCVAGGGRGAGPTVVRRATLGLDAIRLPAGLGERALEAVSRRPAGGPLRLVLRGRPGSGRRTLLAALARRANRRLGVIDALLLPAGAGLVEALRAELQSVHLGGQLACVANLDRLPADAAGQTQAEALRQLFRAHPVPVTFALGPDAQPPLDPGYAAFDLPTLEEGDRVAFWRTTLARAGVRVRDVEALGARWRITPGAMTRAAEAVAGAGGGDALAELERVIRQGLASRLGAVATPVTRLASWSSVVLCDEVRSSVLELIGRIRHRRQVYESWGYDGVMTSSRGLTALLQGGPGTGKTMVAGIVARELGLDLYRVDLSRIASKWIGETERNLGEVFDAAEDGQAILLFDEADSLFAKRTEVQSSQDRYANGVVNYLLTRLDSFGGIAILTTNFGGSIDPAFRRRMSFTLAFPHPDEEMREKLWRAHLPRDLPIAGSLDLARLARRFSMTGGTIRNAALRAAFLAAAEGTPLGQAHLEQAVELEYRDTGKLAPSGTLE